MTVTRRTFEDQIDPRRPFRTPAKRPRDDNARLRSLLARRTNPPGVSRDSAVRHAA